LLLHYEIQHCDVQSIYEQAGPQENGQLAMVVRFLHRKLLQQSIAHVAWQTSNPTLSEGALRYTVDNESYLVLWSDFHPRGVPERRRLTLRGCIFAPVRVEVFDIAVDRSGTGARVLFMNQNDYTWLGERLNAFGTLTGNNALPYTGGFEQVAEVTRRSSRGKWRIRDVWLN
jgi:hypothetical protein